MRKIAIIPARSGSKGLVDKNIKLLNGKPLMSYSIEAAIKSGIFDEVMVSTDSEKYAEIAVKCGANVPFLRSLKTSSDTATSWDMVAEVLGKYKDLKQQFDVITLLQPTSPLRNASDIIHAYQIFQQKEAQAVLSVCEMEHTPLWSNVLPEDGSLADFINVEKIGKGGRQTLDKYYRLNGAIYMLRTDGNPTKIMFQKGSYAYVMPQNRSVDIDSELDFMYAEMLLNYN